MEKYRYFNRASMYWHARISQANQTFGRGNQLNRQMILRILLVTTIVLPLAIIAIMPAFGGTTGIISGTVTDFATSEKLAGVNVIIEGTNLTTVTDAKGYFVITNVPPGEHKVTASLVGYSDFQVSKVNVIMDATTTVDCALSAAVANEETVIIKESRPMIQRDIIPTTYVVDTKQEQMVRGQVVNLYETPGLVLTQPGVVADADGYPHIRGGRVNQVGYMLDGIPVTEPVTNGFGTNIMTIGLDKMQMFSGGYRPEYGNAISGVFNQIVKTGHTAPGGSLELIGGSQSFEGVYPQMGGSFDNGGDYYVGAYAWHSDLKGLQYNEVDCSDTIGKFNYPLSKNNKVTLLTASGSGSFQFPSIHTSSVSDNVVGEIAAERDHNHQSYTLNALTLSHTISPSSFFTVRPYYFLNRNKVDALSEELGRWTDMESATTGLQFDYTNQVSERHLIKAGAIRMSSNNRYQAKVPALDGYGLGPYDYTANTDTVQSGLYLQDQMRLSPRWNAEAGIRYDRMAYDKVATDDSTESQWSPRFGLSYAVDPKSNLRFSYGKMIQFVYTQAIERQYVDPESGWAATYYGAGSGNLRPERSTQYDIGWEHEMNTDYLVQVTPFYRKYSDMLQTTMLDPANPDISPIVYDNIGVGTSKGIEFLVKKRVSNNWSGWLSYTYSQAMAEANSDRDMISPGTMRYVDWDQRHTAVLVLNRTNNKWSYSLMGEFGSGLPYTLEGEDSNSHRAPWRTVFDLNIAREVTGGWLPTGEIHFGIANVFNVATVLRRDPTGEPTARVAPRFLSLSYLRRF